MPCTLASLESLEVERARRAGFKANIQRILQRLHLGFVFFQQAQPCPDYIACGTIASALHLGLNNHRLKPVG